MCYVFFGSKSNRLDFYFYDSVQSKTTFEPTRHINEPKSKDMVGLLLMHIVVVYWF